MTNLTKEYEIFYFLPIAFTPEEVASTREKMAAIINRYAGKITKEEDLGKKKLSFAIKGARHGYYFLTQFIAEAKQVGQVDREIKLLPEIIRHRLVIKEEYKLPHVSTGSHATAEKNEELSPTIKKIDEPKEKTEETGKVDMHELDRKIDELLLEDI